jgi:hypothetical protein
MAAHGDSWLPMAAHGGPWRLTVTHGNSWRLMVAHGALCTLHHHAANFRQFTSYSHNTRRYKLIQSVTTRHNYQKQWCGLCGEHRTNRTAVATGRHNNTNRCNNATKVPSLQETKHG